MPLGNQPGISNIFIDMGLQWNPSCETTTFAPPKWLFKRSGLSSGVEINNFTFTLVSGLSRGVGLSSGGLTRGVKL